MNTTAEVVYRQLNNCLVNLPHALVNPLLQSNILLQSICIEFSWADKLKGAKQTHNFYTGWSGHLSAQSTTSNTPTVEIDSNFALSLNLREKTKVNIRVLLDLPRIISVELEPQTVSDWEITEIHAQFIEDRLLNQVRCVAKNQLVLAFPNSNNVVKFIVKSIKSESGDLEKGMLGNDSELHIAPKVYRRESVKDTNGNNNRRRRSVSSRRSSRSILLPAVILRGISLPHKLYSNLPQTSAYEIFINFNQPSVYPQLKNASHVQISLIPGPGTPARAINNTSIDNNHRPSMNGNTSENDHHRSNSNGNANGNSRHSSSSSLNGTANLAQLPNVPEAKKITAKLTHSSNISPGETCLSELLTVALGIEQRVGDLICIEIAPSALEKLKSNTIVVHKYVTHTPSINEISIKGGNNAFENKKELKSKNDKLSKEFQEIFDSKHINLWNSPLTNGIKLPKIPDLLSEGGFLEFKKENKLNESNWCLFQQSGEIPRIEIGEDHLRPESFIPLNKIEKESDKLKEGEEEEDIVIGQEEIIDDVAKSLKRSSESGVLLYGSSGSGKTIISKEVAKVMFDKSGYYVKFVSCEDLPLNNFTNLKNQLVEILNEVSWHSPSLLVLENIDSIIPVEMENTDSSLSRQLSEILITKLSNLMSQRKIALLCTAKSKESLNEAVYQTHLLEDDFQLRAPDKELRKLLFKHYLAKMNVDIGEHSELLNDIGVETEGYLPLDLKILVDRSYHDLISQTLESESNNNDENEDDDEDEDNNSLNIELRLSWSNVEKALENFTPSSLRGAKLQKSSVSWQDIGGLKEAKSILLETLEWPTKYAPIFANCPLRLRSGILLYGYPGCGKTLLASALAAQCGLNFISIKGPEILNKYIGASEQSVRELFERAQAAKPCILFFDEFDSIAPKRGHDSTGVTDRVVNQMLTQMDGAEGLDGVYVLAATSRPDLIDSALLRPGRLDKSVICDVPNLEDRLDILKCVTRTMKLADDVSLEDVASRCAGFSGADLQGLAYNAYLKAVHDKLEKLQLETSQNDDENNEDNNTTNNIDFIQVSQAVSTTKQTRSNIHNERIKMSVKLQQIISTYEEALSGNKSSSLSSKDKNKSNDDTNLNDEVVITPLDFEHSLKETKSSISQSELKKLQKIYDQFLNGRDGNMPDGQPSNEIGGRTTLM